MLRFLLLYLSVYPLVHYYVFCKIKAAFSPGRKTCTGIVLFMGTMIAAPIMVRLSEKVGIETGARFWAYASFSWMGLLFLFITLAAIVDVIGFVLWTAAKSTKRTIPMPKITPRQLFAVQAIIVATVYGYGLFEAADIRIEHIEIASPKIAASSGRVRIAQISDVHLGLIIRESRLKQIIAKIEEKQPDIVVSTGDLVDGQLNHLTTEARLLAALHPPLGKFAVTGNHEFYAGLQDALTFTKKAGFTILRQEGVTIGPITVVGVDDPAGRTFGKEPATSEHDLLAAQSRRNFTLLLKHRPDINPDSLTLFDLQLSGHTHKGQVFPFNLITWFFYPEKAGQLTTLKSGFLYLSRGTGTWGPPIRVLSPPEVAIIDLVHGQ